MRIIIRQKYWTIGEKFQITDDDGKVIFYAERTFDRLMSNVVLFDVSGAPLGRMQAELKKFFTTWFDIVDANGQREFSIDEKLPFFAFRRAITADGSSQYKIKSGPVHMKAFVQNRDGSFDKTPVVKARKKLLSISDTYVIDIDEQRINPVHGAFIGIWYDLVSHKNH